MAEKPLTDYSDDALLNAYRGSVTHVEYVAKDYWEELLRRQQQRLATALNRWTKGLLAVPIVPSPAPSPAHEERPRWLIPSSASNGCGSDASKPA
jgi:hypothetical protein